MLGYDSTHDVAVLRLKGASGLTVAPLGSSSTVKVGDDVVAVGNAGRQSAATPSAVAGTVRALDQQITVQDERDGSAEQLSGLIQFDAAIQPGDSGGAVVDEAGKVVGDHDGGVRRRGLRRLGRHGRRLRRPDRPGTVRSRSRSSTGRSSSTVHIGGTGFLGVQVAPGSPQGTGHGGRRRWRAWCPAPPAERAGIRAG